MEIIDFIDGSAIPRGDTFKVTLIFEVDINGWTIWFTVKEPNDFNDDDSQAKIQKFETISGSAYTYDIELTPEDTDIDAGIYVYDVQIKQDSGEISTPFKGKFQIVDTVTRSTE